MNPRARQLLEEAQAAYLKSLEYQRKGYALEEQAKELLDGKRELQCRIARDVRQEAR